MAIQSGHEAFHSDQYSLEKVQRQSEQYYQHLKKRRSLRFFSDRSIPRKIIENIIMSASSAPSGANKQPWTFCAISDHGIKKKIREAAEKEEYENYHGRMNEEWLDDLAPLATDWNKPFLETAPWLIVMFRQVYDLEDGQRKQNYYVNESVGIAAGFLLTAIHQCGLVALTHTPSPMNFLEAILDRPKNERAYLLIPVGYAAPDATVPTLPKKKLSEVAIFFESKSPDRKKK